MKYNFDLETWAENNSLTKIIRRMKPNSIVLEFGCANGRLTRFLKEKMNCDVTIVEIEEEAGKEASGYAVQSLLGQKEGNIETFFWAEKLKGKKFDYILFADVLEHLRDPETVLKQCKAFLKEDGSILVSIPNIANNSIIASLLQNEFEYQNVGLLDNTHIKFYTYYTFKRMINRLEYVMVYETGTYNKIGETELPIQFDAIPQDLRKSLVSRDFGDVYQYVFEFKNMTVKNPIIELVSEFSQSMTSYYQTVFYLKHEDDVSEYNSIRFSTNGGLQKHTIHLNSEQEVTSIRLDPMNCNCIMQLHKAISLGNENDLNVKHTNADLNVQDYYYFLGEDPYIEFDCQENQGSDIYFEYTILNFDFENNTPINKLLDMVKKEHNLIQNKENEIAELRELLDQKSRELETLCNMRIDDIENFKKQEVMLEKNNNDIINLNDLAHSLSNEIESKDAKIKQFDQTINELQTKINEHNSKFYHFVKIK